MRKLISSLLVIVFGLFLVSSVNTKADGPIVEAIDEASIRTIGEQGLRFYAKLNGQAEEHGFYLVFGEATVQQLKTALANKEEDKNAILNEKDVFKVDVPGVTEEKEFSVVLTEIPGPGYLQNISVFPYAVVDEEEIIADSVTRSVGEVALKAAAKGEIYQDVIDELEINFKRLGMNAFGELELTGNMFETNHFKLREEFIKDWNAKFGTTWTELVGSTFDAHAQVGQQTGDLSGTRSYQFFNDPLYKDKWEFVLNIMVLKGSGTIWPMVQAQALLGDGTVDGRPNLHVGRHLHFSIANFFNGNYEVYGYSGVNFLNRQMYIDVVNMINGIHVNFSEYEFYKLGDEFEFEAAPVKNGYNFANYKVGEQTYLIGSQYEVSSNILIELEYTPILYTVKFYDNELELEDIETTYNIETGLLLPVSEKEGHQFVGWYDNNQLSGSIFTSIEKGETGNKTYYAKFEEGFSVTYEFGKYGYVLDKTREEFFDEFMEDFKIVFGRAGGPKDTFYTWSYWQVDKEITDIFEGEYLEKYGWLKTYILDLATETSYAQKAGLISYTRATWRTNLHALINENEYTGNTLSMNFSNKDNANGFWTYSPYGRAIEYFVSEGALFDGLTIASWDLEYEFVGWYTDAALTIPITNLPETVESNITLYAKWEREVGETSNITYELDGGDFYKYISRAELITDFMADYKRKTGRVEGPEEFSVSTDPIVNGFLLEEEIASKWGWLLDYMIGLSEDSNHPRTDDLIARTGNIWRWTIHAFLNKAGGLAVNTVDYSIPTNADSFWPSMAIDYPEVYEHGHELTLLIPGKDGFTFGGWYLESDFSGTAVTKIETTDEGDITLYAKWN